MRKLGGGGRSWINCSTIPQNGAVAGKRFEAHLRGIARLFYAMLDETDQAAIQRLVRFLEADPDPDEHHKIRFEFEGEHLLAFVTPTWVVIYQTAENWVVDIWSPSIA